MDDRDEMAVLRDDEIESYIIECLKVLCIMNDKGSSSFGKLRSSFLADMERLLELGRITPDEYNEVTNEDNFSF